MSFVRRSLQIVAFLCTLLVGVTAMTFIVSQTAWFRDWLRGFIVRQADAVVNGTLSIGRLDGNLFFGVTLSNVGVTMDGTKAVDVEQVAVDYSVWSFLGGNIVLDEIRLTRPVIRAVHDESGWNLQHIVKARTPDKPASNRTVEIGEIAVTDGTVYVDDRVGTGGVTLPARIEQLQASLGIKSNADELEIELGRVALSASEPELVVRELTGVVRRTKEAVALENFVLRTGESDLRANGSIATPEGGPTGLDIKASSETLAMAEIARLVPALRGYALRPTFEVEARGPMDRLAIDLNLREPELGNVTGDLSVDALTPRRRVAGDVTLERFNFGPLVPQTDDRPRTGTPLRSDITGKGRIDLALPEDQLPLSGTYELDAQRVQAVGYEARNVVARGRIDGPRIRVTARALAYGGSANVDGVVQTGTPLALDLSGRASNLDLRNLPASLSVPRVPTRLSTAFSLKGRGDRYSGTYTLDESELAGATLASGTTGTFAVGGGAPSYSAKGGVSGLDLQQIGNYFDITALATDRYKSRVNGEFDVTGSGGGRFPLSLDASGTLRDTEVFGATMPEMAFTAGLGDGDLQVTAKGQFVDLNPATISGDDRAAGKLSGAVDVATKLRGYADGVTADSIDVSGRIELQPSTVRDIAIDAAVVAGNYAGREGAIDELSLTSSDVVVTGKGPVSLTETGASDLTLHVESTSLERIGKIIGQPIKGAAIVDATVTGNATSLAAKGALKGSNLGHGENEALSLASDFTVTVPDLTPADAVVNASNVITFLEVGGQRITDLTADVTYAKSTVEFKTTAQEGERALNATGRVILHPDHQEIHLPSLALRAEQVEWRTPEGAEATINYSKDRITVSKLTLVNADQRIMADGVVGSATEPLDVRIENIDLAQVDQLFLGDQRLKGRFNAEATVTGPLDDTRAGGRFALTQGAFRDFTFDSLEGKVDYVKTGVNLDVRLQQNATQWLTAAGFAPLSLFRPTPQGMAGQHEDPAPGEAIDIEVKSSEIGLGVIQGFTSYVTDVDGVMQANLKVTGSGHDPHVEGQVVLHRGKFAVPEFGTSYWGLDTQLLLTPEGLAINGFEVYDDRGFPMNVYGTLAFHARSVGAVNIAVQTNKFEVIDNNLADVKLNTDIQITGEIRKPRVQGSVDIENGTIHIAQLLERLNADAYSTEATTLTAADAPVPATNGGAPPAAPAPGTPSPETAASAPPAAAAADETSVFDALEMDLKFSIPSNLVIRGTDIRAANAPIAIGDMNITVGGELEIRKAPAQQVQLIGDVVTVRGTYAFQGRRFDILRDGRIGFSGTDEIDPLLNLRARREISGIEAFIDVKGTMKMPELSFSSNPPQEEADVLSLIVFNQPINQLGEGQQVSLAQRAGALAGGYLTSGLSRSIGNALELDEFEIQAQGENGAGPSLTVGEQVGRNLFFRVRQAFGSEQTTELMLEYQIRDYLRLQGSIAQGDTTQRVQFKRIERGGLDLIFFFSY